MKINTVTVVGATGTMGRNVAAIFASFGGARVYMVGRDKAKVESVLPKTVASVRADSIRNNLVPADFTELEKCVRASELIFESVTENLELKKSVAARIGAAMSENAVSCTGSSGLSINAIAEVYPEHLRSRVYGVHMFNPPYSMPLCELCPSKYADPVFTAKLKAYLTEVLLRTVIEVRDMPAFLANRIGFQLINSAMQSAEKYSSYGGVDYIDAILGPFTGRAMPPLVTADFVGLDVHKAIVNNIYENTDDSMRQTFILPGYVERCVQSGNLGRKTGCGLYSAAGHTVYDIQTGQYRDKVSYDIPFARYMEHCISEGDYNKAFDVLIHDLSLEAKICRALLADYILYSLYCADTVGYHPTDADAVMATGFNWCPPLALYHALKQSGDIDAIIQSRLPDKVQWINSLPQSKFDFRPFFKSVATE